MEVVTPAAAVDPKDLSTKDALVALLIEERSAAVMEQLKKPWGDLEKMVGRLVKLEAITRPELDGLVELLRSVGWKIGVHSKNDSPGMFETNAFYTRSPSFRSPVLVIAPPGTSIIGKKRPPSERLKALNKENAGLYRSLPDEEKELCAFEELLREECPNSELEERLQEMISQERETLMQEQEAAAEVAALMQETEAKEEG